MILLTKSNTKSISGTILIPILINTWGGSNTRSRVEFIKKYLPLGRHIFEIGSGGGVDALALQESGYQVTASDFSEKFIEILREEVYKILEIRFVDKWIQVIARFSEQPS